MQHLWMLQILIANQKVQFFLEKCFDISIEEMMKHFVIFFSVQWIYISSLYEHLVKSKDWNFCIHIIFPGVT